MRSDLQGSSFGITETDFTFTGQKSVSGTGLMDYKARFYDGYLNRFISPDSIIPGAGDPQAWNRYAGMKNNPIVYRDPSGHRPIIDDKDIHPIVDKNWKKPKGTVKSNLVVFDDTYAGGFSDAEKSQISQSASDIANKMAWVINRANQCSEMAKMEGLCLPRVSAEDAFLKIFGGPITFFTHTNTCAEFWGDKEYTCWGTAAGKTVFVFSNAPANGVASVKQFPVHEIFHIFDTLLNRAASAFARSDPILMGRGGLDNAPGWQQNTIDTDYPGSETFADLSIAWTYSHYNPNAQLLDPDIYGASNYSDYTRSLMDAFMEEQLINIYYDNP